MQLCKDCRCSLIADHSEITKRIPALAAGQANVNHKIAATPVKRRKIKMPSMARRARALPRTDHMGCWCNIFSNLESTQSQSLVQNGLLRSRLPGATDSASIIEGRVLCKCTRPRTALGFLRRLGRGPGIVSMKATQAQKQYLAVQETELLGGTSSCWGVPGVR